MSSSIKHSILVFVFKFIGNVYNKSLDLLFANPTFFNKSDFEITKDFEENFEALRAEFMLISKDRTLPYIDDIFQESQELNKKKTWRSFFLKSYFHNHEKNLEKLPKTKKLINSKNICSAFYSQMEPNSEIAAHVGQNKGLIRILFPLKVPKNNEECYIVVNGEKRVFEEANSLIFDDYFEHFVINNTTEDRVVLFIDYVRPLPFPFNSINNLALKVIGNSSFMKKMRVNSDLLS